MMQRYADNQRWDLKDSSSNTNNHLRLSNSQEIILSVAGSFVYF